jgi:hypothetical protein
MGGKATPERFLKIIMRKSTLREQNDQKNGNSRIYIDMQSEYLQTTPDVPGSMDKYNCLWRDPAGPYPDASHSKAPTRVNRRRRKALCRDLERVSKALAGWRSDTDATG